MDSDVPASHRRRLSTPARVTRPMRGLAAIGLVLVALSAASAGAAPAAAAPAASAPYPLFGGKPLEWERSGGKVVGVYTPNWQPAALVDALHGDSVTHVIYAFLHVCGPGQLAVDKPKCDGKPDFSIATSQVDDTFDAAFARLKKRAPHVDVLASIGGWGGSDP